MANPQSVKRRNFVKQFMLGGLTYMQATKAYDSMMATFTQAVVQGKKICLGRTMALTPQMREPRKVKMNFRNVPGGKRLDSNRTFVLGRRVVYTVRLHSEFLRKTDLDWA